MSEEMKDNTSSYPHMAYNHTDDDGNLCGYCMDSMTINEYINTLLPLVKQELDGNGDVYVNLEAVQYTTTNGRIVDAISIEYDISKNNTMCARYQLNSKYERFKTFIFTNEDGNHHMDYFHFEAHELRQAFHDHIIMQTKDNEELRELISLVDNDSKIDTILESIYPELIDLQVASVNNDANDFYTDVIDQNKGFGWRYKIDSSSGKYAINMNNRQIEKLLQQTPDLRAVALVNLNNNVIKTLHIESIIDYKVNQIVNSMAQALHLPPPSGIKDKIRNDIIEKMKNSAFIDTYIVGSNNYNSTTVLLSRTAMLAIAKKIKVSRYMFIIPSSVEKMIVMNCDNAFDNNGNMLMLKDEFPVTSDSFNKNNAMRPPKEIAFGSPLFYDVLNDELIRFDDMFAVKTTI